MTKRAKEKTDDSKATTNNLLLHPEGNDSLKKKSGINPLEKKKSPEESPFCYVDPL